MSGKSVQFCDLKSRVVSGTLSQKGWKAVDYEIADYKGNMLVARKGEQAGAIALKLDLQGWHRIFLCILHIESKTSTYFSLDEDHCHTPVYSRSHDKNWGAYEYVEEVFWKCADLSGQNLTVEHHDAFSSALVWVRCEPMDNSEVEQVQSDFSADTKRLFAFIDPGIYNDHSFSRTEDYSFMLNAMKDSDVLLAAQDVSLQHSGYKTEEEESRQTLIYREMTDYARKLGIKLYASNRMNLANFCIPYNFRHTRFVDEHPEWNQVNRCGKTINGALSYAFEEVQDYVAGWLTQRVRAGFDGVSLIFTRGIHIAFEEPVQKAFALRYPGINPNELPVTDARLNGVWGDFMTQFMRKLRHSLNGVATEQKREKPGISVYTYFDFDNSRHFGLNIETWARESLIDSVVQANMTHFEDLDGCMKDDDPSLIDLTKYREKLKTSVILRRRHGNEVEGICANIPKYRAINDPYNIRLFSDLPWEGGRPSLYLEAAQKMYAAGADGIAAWDSNYRIPVLPVWNITAKIGHQAQIDEMLAQNDDYGKLFRVLSIDGHDISEYQQNWRG